MNRLVTTLALVSTLAASAQADLITWNAPQDATGPSDVRTNGTLVTARNCFASGFSFAPTVNGVPFSAFAPSGWNNAASAALNGSSSGDTPYNQLLDGARATSEATLTNPTGWGGIRLDSLGVLTVGKTYEIQVWYSDQRVGAGATALNDRVMSLSSATGAATLTSGVVNNLGSLTQGPVSVGLEADPNNTFGAGDTVLGQYAVGTFTRASTQQLWLLVQGSHPTAANTLRPHVSAFQIRELPPPPPVSTYCTAGTSTNGCVPAISGTGSASVSASSGFVLDVANIEGQKQGLFFYGVSGQASSPWSAGSSSFLCVKSPTQRMGALLSGGTLNGCDGAFSQDWLAFVAANPSALGAPYSAGQVVNAQAWYRDPPAVKTTNLSNGLEFTLAP